MRQGTHVRHITADPSRWPRPVILHHIQKTAGTTLGRILNKNYTLEVTHGFKRGLKDVAEFAERPQAERDSYDYLRGHINFGLHDLLSRPATYVTLLRHPVDRVLSFYHHVLRTPDHYLYRTGFTADVSLRELLEQRGCIELDNFQVRALNRDADARPRFGEVDEAMLASARANLDQFDAVGLTERFDEFAGLVERRYGWWVGSYTSARVAPGRPAADDLDGETRRAIERQNELDLALYGDAIRLFEQRLENPLGPRIFATANR